MSDEEVKEMVQNSPLVKRRGRLVKIKTSVVVVFAIKRHSAEN